VDVAQRLGEPRKLLCFLSAFLLIVLCDICVSAFANITSGIRAGLRRRQSRASNFLEVLDLQISTGLSSRRSRISTTRTLHADKFLKFPQPGCIGRCGGSPCNFFDFRSPTIREVRRPFEARTQSTHLGGAAALFKQIFFEAYIWS
jgi:hypothetical protein